MKALFMMGVGRKSKLYGPGLYKWKHYHVVADDALDALGKIKIKKDKELLRVDAELEAEAD